MLINFRAALTHPLWDALGLLLAIIAVCKLLHPSIPLPWRS